MALDYLKNMWQEQRGLFILYVLGYVLVLAFFIFIIYFILFRGLTQTDVTTNTNNANVNSGLPLSNNTNGLPTNGAVNTNTNVSTSLPEIDTVARGSDTLVSSLTDVEIDGVRIDGSTISYYDPSAGRFYRKDSSGTVTQMGDAFFPNAGNVQWSPTQDQVIFATPDGKNVFYDLKTGKQSILPVEMSQIRFSATGSQIGYKFYAPNIDNRFLGVSNPDGTELKVIETLGTETTDVEVNWSPSSQIIATYRKSTGGESQNVYFVGQEGENFENLEVDGRGFTGKWSPNGRQMLYSIYSDDTDYKPRLWIANADGSDLTGTGEFNLGVETYADKCAFASETTAYCAVPRRLETGSGIYRELADDTQDRFYSINVTTGVSSLIANPVDSNGNNNVRATDLRVSDDGKTLYYINEETGKLESLALK